MKWEDRDGSSNVLVSGGKAVGGGIGSIIIGLILWLVFGMNPVTAMQTGSAITGGNSSGQQTLDQQTADRDQKFASVVLKDTEEVWGQIFSENNMQYQQPKYNQQYHAVFMPVYVNAYNCSLFYVLHTCLLVDKARRHKIGSFQNEFESSLISSESWVHVRIRMDCFHSWYTIIVY